MYARDIIGNMNNHSAAWVVWGMAFDTGGGPNHAKNFNHSPIMVDLQQQQLHYNPSYWYIAHFSKFVQPGAYRIEFQKNQSNLEITAFQNPNGQVVVALLNTSNQKVACQLKWGERFLPFTVDAKCIKTVIWQN
jgi:glucosylceramidase